MPTPERKSGWSRRPFEPPQDRSPFRRAHLDSRATDRVDASHLPNPSYGSTSRRRRNYSQTGTLRGAFEAISRYPSMSENEDFLTDPYALGTRNRRRQSFNPTSPDSNPPNELAETYRQIDDAGSLIDLDAPEDDDVYIPRAQFRGSRSRGSSLGSTKQDHGLFTHTDTNYLENATESPYRRTSRDPIRDEQRLRRATSSRSPVLNRTGNANALTSENLQRREEEEEAHVSEEEDGFKPTLNLPQNWGSRGTHRRDWLRDITRRKEPEAKEAVEEPTATSPPKFDLDLASRNTHSEHTSNTNRATTDERPANRYSRVPLSDARNKLSSEHKTEKLTGGDQIPNTPIMVYKNSTFTKRSPTKRDSHDLLRKLSRTESPGQSQRLSELRTPEGPKMPENRIYDKTPVVTGAWIDTPVTERADRFPEHLSKDIVPSPVKRDQPTGDTQQQQMSHAAEKSVAFELQSQKEQERETELRKEREKAERERKEKEREASEAKTKEEAKSEKGNVEKKKDNQTDKSKDTQKPPLIKPDLPKSALETVMQDFKADKDRLDVGDDTIESLQLILDEQPNGMKTEAEEDAAYEKSVMEKLELAGSKGRDVVDLDGLNEKLRSFSENINRVKKGLDGLEQQVDLIPTSKKDIKSLRNRASEGCETCRSHHHHDYSSSAIPIPLLWKRDPVTRRVWPTRLAWFIALLFAWSYAESTMCDYYCHPIVATACEGNCLLRDAPQFPFVLPTMLWRWSHLSGVLAPVWALVFALFRLFGQLLGFWDGYVEEPPHAYNLSGEIRIRGSQTRDFAIAAATPTRGFFGFGAPKLQENTYHSRVPEPVPELRLNQNPAGASNDDGSMDDDEYI